MIKQDTSDTIEINIEPFERMVKAFILAGGQACRIGVLGTNDHRSKGGTTNAEVGAAHEYGTSQMKQRSFLRIPLTEHLQAYMDKSNMFDENALKKVIKEKSVKEWFKKMGIIAENIVQDAFATGGFGKWDKWKNPDYENNTGQILVDTQQLRNSITSEVK